MVTLKELVDMQRLTNISDEEIIIKWFVENNKSAEGIEIISKIAAKKIENDEFKYGKLIGDLSMYAGTKYLVEKYGIDIGCELDKIITLYIMGCDIKTNYQNYYKWLQDTIPTLDKPDMFWREFYDWLHENGIDFKGGYGV